MADSTVLLVHGSFFSGWCWLPVIERLDGLGTRAATVELPFTSLADDVAVLRDAIAAARAHGPVTVVSHSYTGITASMAGHDASHLVFVAARMPAVGESQSELNPRWGDPDFRSCFKVDPDGTMSLLDGARDHLFNRTSPGLADFAMRNRRSMRSEIPVEPLENPAWTNLPCSYVVCTDDRAVRLDQQRLRAGWATHSVEIDCDHSPFFSAPRETAEFIHETHVREAR